MLANNSIHIRLQQELQTDYCEEGEFHAYEPTEMIH
jgi:hypothetical protein